MALMALISIPNSAFFEKREDVLQVNFMDFGGDRTFQRGVPVQYVETHEGRIPVTTVFDLLMAQFGVPRGLAGEYPASYDDEEIPSTPAWQEKFTGVGRKTVVQLAREFATTAEKTKGKCTIIIGSGVNHWYHANLHYRAGIASLILCGCVGVNGGGLNHYTGQEKLTPMASWSTLAMALDWTRPPRLQNGPSFHYVHSDQWRYEKAFTDYHPAHGPFAEEHFMDLQVAAVRMGWLPFYPQFNRNPIQLVREAEEAGAKTDARKLRTGLSSNCGPGKSVFRLKIRIPRKLASGLADLAGECLAYQRQRSGILPSALPRDASQCHCGGSGRRIVSEDVVWREARRQGKMDLVVDLNFRMDTSALYSDVFCRRQAGTRKTT